MIHIMAQRIDGKIKMTADNPNHCTETLQGNLLDGHNKIINSHYPECAIKKITVKTLIQLHDPPKKIHQTLKNIIDGIAKQFDTAYDLLKKSPNWNISENLSEHDRSPMFKINR